MSDTVENIYCTDNNDALLASVMGKNNNDPKSFYLFSIPYDVWKKWIMGKQC